MVAHLAHSVRQLVVRGDHRTGITAGPQVLSRVEAEASGVAGGAGPLAAAGRALRLRRVLDHGDAVPCGDRHHRRHVDTTPVQVDRDDGARPWRDRAFQPGRVHQQGLPVHVDEARDGATANDGLRRGRKRVRDRDHLIARAHADRPERQLQGIGPIRTGDGLGGATVGGVLFLELPHLFSQDEVGGGENPIDRLLEIASQLLVLGPQVSERYARSRPRWLRLTHRHRRVLLHLRVR